MRRGRWQLSALPTRRVVIDQRSAVSGQILHLSGYNVTSMGFFIYTRSRYSYSQADCPTPAECIKVFPGPAGQSGQF